MLADTSPWMGIHPMNTLSRLALAVAVGAFAVPALAAVPSAADAAAHNTLMSKTNGQLAEAAAAAKANRAAANGAKAYGQNTYPGSPGANPYRTYPPSCAAYPLPDAPSGPDDQIYRTTMPFWTRDAAGDVLAPEIVGVTIWRIACSSGGSVTPYNSNGTFYNSMTFFRVDRSSANEGHPDYYPTLPLLQTTQQTSDLSDQSTYIRLAAEPNTVVSEGQYDAPLYNSTTFVLENYNLGSDYYHEYNDAFTLVVNPALAVSDGGAIFFNIDAYSPTTSTYPDAFNDLPIDGYMSTSWYDPSHPGEGITVQVYDNGDSDPTHRTFAAFWYTYDSTGRPYWLVAQGTIDVGATSFQADVTYTDGGGFAGAGGTATQVDWGTISGSFPDCNTMNFSFDGNTDAATAGPGGSGTRTWLRLASQNIITCE
jgi:hypothetical protein